MFTFSAGTELMFQHCDLCPLFYQSPTSRPGDSLCVFVHTCVSVCVGGCVSGPLMSWLITVESLGLSLALWGSNTRSSQQQGGEMKTTIRYLFFHRKSRKSSAKTEHLFFLTCKARWGFDFDLEATEGFTACLNTCTQTRTPTCVYNCIHKRH